MTFHLPKKRQAITVYKKTTVPRYEQHPLKKVWSVATVTLSLFCLLIIFLANYQPTQRLISPILSPLEAIRSWTQQNNSHYETFTFVPSGSSSTKLQRIDYTGLKTLAYYDLPVDMDGTFVYDALGYEMLKSEETQELFSTARANGAAVVLTMTQTYNNEIKGILDTPLYQQTLIDEAIREVKGSNADGVTVDFEFNGSAGPHYRALFTQFVANLTKQMHEQVPHSQVSVAIADVLPADALYDVSELADASDKVMIMAYTFAVPELKGKKLTTPLHLKNSDGYMHTMETHIATLAKDVPVEKLVIERAWYGNGENYPLYRSNSAEPLGGTGNHNTLKTPLSPAIISALVQDLPYKSRLAAKKNLPSIAKALEKEGILNPNVLSYALATIEHETAGTFEPIDEFKGKKSARRLGYEGGTNYYGRGYIQLTHLRNYEEYGRRIGLGDKLAEKPELASDPSVAAAVLAAYFKKTNVAYWATQGDFVTARIPINPDGQGTMIAYLAWRYLAVFA